MLNLHFGRKKDLKKSQQGVKKPLKSFTLEVILPSGEIVRQPCPNKRIRWQQLANICRDAGLSPHPPAANLSPWLEVKAQVLDGPTVKDSKVMRVKSLKG